MSRRAESGHEIIMAQHHGAWWQRNEAVAEPLAAGRSSARLPPQVSSFRSEGRGRRLILA